MSTGKIGTGSNRVTQESPQCGRYSESLGGGMKSAGRGSCFVNVLLCLLFGINTI